MKNNFIILLAILLCFVALALLQSKKTKLHKLQIKHQLNHIDLITQENQYLLCDNERLLATLDSLPLGSPITDNIKISSNYGWRKNPLGIGWRFHGGLDIHAAWWDTIYATGTGIVSTASWNYGYGRCIVINHAGSYKAVYGHLYKIFVKRGELVSKGQPIGRAGNSGAVTGPHLHYEIRRNNKTTDPLEYIDVLFNNLLTP